MGRALSPYPSGACDALFVFEAETHELVGVSIETRVLLGLPLDEAIPVALGDHFTANPPNDLATLLSRGRDSGPGALPRAILPVHRRDGRPLHLDLRVHRESVDSMELLLVSGIDVTEAQRKESELRRARAFLEAAIRQSGIGIVMMQGDAGETTIANRAAREILGVSEVDEASPLIAAADWPEIRRDGHTIQPEDYPVVRAYRHRESISEQELVAVRKDGDVRTLLVSAGPVIDDEGGLLGSIVLFPDITDWKRNEAYLRRRDRMLEILHEHIRDAVYALGEGGRIDYVTPSVERLTGRSRDFLLGKTLEESGILSDSSLAMAESDLRRVLSGTVLASRDYEYVTSRGDIWIGEVIGSPLTDEEERPGALFVVRDVTARRHEADRRAAREAQTRQSQKLEAVGTLAAGFAHEMNNPLTGILNLAEVLELGLVDPSGVPEVARRIRALCDRMSTTVKNLVSFASSDSSTPRVVTLAEAIDKTVELVSPRLKRAAITVARTVSPGPTPQVLARPGELQQLLLVLVSNACDAVAALVDPPAERRVIEIVLSHDFKGDTAVARLAIRDRGVGIPADHVHRIYDPFFTTKATDRGVGLGLWVASGIARDHGGTLDFETREGYGTTFVLELPSATTEESL